MAVSLSTNLGIYNERPKLRQRHRYLPRQTFQEAGTPDVVVIPYNRRRDAG